MIEPALFPSSSSTNEVEPELRRPASLDVCQYHAEMVPHSVHH